MINHSMIGRIFKVLDCHGRFWGTFVVKTETNFFGSHNIHGTLIPSEDFEAVRPLFAQYELEMEKEGDTEEVNVNGLLELNPYLVDDESDEIIDISGTLFITENLLVTCEVENP